MRKMKRRSYDDFAAVAPPAAAISSAGGMVRSNPPAMKRWLVLL
jgi:hypothetical protein